MKANEIEMGQMSPHDSEWVYSAATMAQQGVDVRNKYIVGAPGQALEPHVQALGVNRLETNIREVFVVHGRNDAAREAMFAFLRSIDLIPLEWNVAREETGKPSPYIGEILQVAFSRVHAVVVLLTPDDEVRLKSQFRTNSDPPHETQLTGQARSNVLFEAGMAMGGQPDRVVLVELGALRTFTDIAGLHIVRMDDSSPMRQEFAQKLRTAGCPADLNGEDWHTAGNFGAAVGNDAAEPVDEEEPEPTEQESVQLSKEAGELLLSASLDSQSMISSVRAVNGLIVQANQQLYTTAGDTRSEARWEQAIEELLEAEYIKLSGNKGDAYKITHKGFQLIDTLLTSSAFS